MNIFAHAGHDHVKELTQTANIDPSTIVITTVIVAFAVFCIALWFMQKKN